MTSVSQRLRLLFVCGGNTCRSPMASAVARQSLGDKVETENAGVAAVEERARPEAVQVVKQECGLDISGHVPRDIRTLDLRDYDVIVAMDPIVGQELTTTFRVPGEKLRTWNIRDPYMRGAEEYRRCLDHIRASLRQVIEEFRLQSEG